MQATAMLDGKYAGRSLLMEIRKDLHGITRMTDVTVSDVLALPDALRLLLRWIIVHRAVTFEEVAGFLGETEEEARSLMDRLEEVELIERLPICGLPRYWVCLNPRRLRPPTEFEEPY